MSTLLSVADFVIVAIILIVFVGVGVYFRFTGGQQKTTLEFLMADKNMPLLPVCFSVFATSISAIALVSTPAEVYYYGMQLIFRDFGYPIGAVIASYCVIPIYFDMDIKTIYEYLERRFSKEIKIVTSLLYTFQTLLYLAIVIYAPSLAFSVLTGLTVWTSIISVTVICIFYSSLGGLKAVLWTDLLQGILMLSTIFILIMKCTSDFGGFGDIFKTAKAGQRLEVLNTSIDFTVRYTVWNGIIHGIVYGLSYNGCTFTIVQRLMTCKNLKMAQKSLVGSAALFLISQLLLFILGIFMFAFYYNCDPVSSKSIAHGDQLVPLFTIELLKNLPALPGLCVAGIFSASLSTMSSMVNSLVAVTLEDYIRPLMKHRLRESTAVLLAKSLVVVYGGVGLLLTCLIANTKGIQEVGGLFLSMIAGVTLGIFFLGMFTVKANASGALIGLIVGATLNFWIGFGSLYNASRYPPLPLSTTGCSSNEENSYFSMTRSDVNLTAYTESHINTFTTPLPTTNFEERYVFPLYKISFMWLAFLGFIFTFIAGYGASVIIGFWKPQGEVDPKQISPIVRKWLCNPTSTVEKECLNLQHQVMQGKSKEGSQECTM